MKKKTYISLPDANPTPIIALNIKNCPRFLIDQLVRHEQGVVKNVQSFRYVDKNNFSFAVPEEIKDDELLLSEYYGLMNKIATTYNDIATYVYNKTNSKERAHEQARYIIPMATESEVNVAFTVEALIHFCNMRLCIRTEDKHRELACAIRDAVIEILPELKDKLVPNCQALLWCPEGKKGCGAYPTKQELREKINGN